MENGYNLKAEELKPLIDLYSVNQKRDLYKLDEEQILEFSKSLTAYNPLLREILSDPSGEIDEETIEGDELLNDFLNASSIEGIDDFDDLGELFN